MATKRNAAKKVAAKKAKKLARTKNIQKVKPLSARFAGIADGTSNT